MTEDQKEIVEAMKGRMKFLYWDAMDFRREFLDRRKEADEMLHWLDNIWFWLCRVENEDASEMDKQSA